MKILVTVICLFIFRMELYSQAKKIEISKVVGQQIKGSRCLDALWNISNVCPLGQERLTIKFYLAFIDEKEKSLRLIGRVQFTDKEESIGLSGIEIFGATVENNKLINRTKLGETTDGREFMNNDGFFDVTIPGDNNVSLFFYGYRYFVEEFAVSRLLQ